MSLPIRTAGQIIQDAIEYFVGANTKLTDLTVGSIIRTLLEAYALQQSHLEVAVGLAANEAIEQSSYTTFGFSRAQPVAATGTAIFTIAAGSTGTIVIPQGTQVRVPGISLKVYQTTARASLILTGSPQDPSQIEVAIVATTPGQSGNAQAGTISQLVTPLNGISAVSNPQTIFNGSDLETDAERRVRFAQFVQSLQRSTRSAVLAGALSTRILDAYGNVTDQVRKANTVENDPFSPDAASPSPNLSNPPPGWIWIFVHNGVSTPTDDLVAACQQVIDGWEDTTTTPATLHPGFKAAGIAATVFAAQEVEVPVALSYDIDNGYIASQVETEIGLTVARFFQALDITDTLIVEQLKRRIAATPGVLDMQLATPTTNVAAAFNQLVIAGAVTIEPN